MKIILLAVIACSVILTDGRFTEKPTTIKIKYVNTTPTIRATRNVFDEDISKEGNVQSIEVERPSKTKLRLFFRNKARADVVRVPRESNENIENTTRNTSDIENNINKSKLALVKKPIPKFNELDYDDEFQVNAIKAPTKYADSAEHEDEDFNLNDYDFDVNHDEFAGRGKPLEPRVKVKKVKEQPQNQQSEEAESEPNVKSAPIFKIQSKVVIPTMNQQANKIERITKTKTMNRDVAKIKEDDYYDDFATTITIKAPEKDNKPHTDDEVIEESEDSKEASTRTVRSSWNQNFFANKLKEKSTALMSKVLTILPIFPQFHQNGYDDSQIPLSNQPMVDPMTGKAFIM